jgi:hypothetical protein
MEFITKNWQHMSAKLPNITLHENQLHVDTDMAKLTGAISCVFWADGPKKQKSENLRCCI